LSIWLAFPGVQLFYVLKTKTVKAAALKQQISKFYQQIQKPAFTFYFSQQPVINVKASLLCGFIT